MPDAKASIPLAMQYQLEMSQRLEPSELSACQFRQLRESIQHAFQTVPHYQECFTTAGIKKIPEVIDSDFLLQLPVLDRASLQANPTSLVSARIPASHGKTYTIRTSGSTGVPVEVMVTDYTRFLWRAFTLREHVWHNRDFGKKLCVIRWMHKDIGQPPEGRRNINWGTAIDAVYNTGPAVALNISTPLIQQVQWLQDQAPAYLLSFPSNLAALAHYCIDHHIHLPGLIEVKTVGENLTSEQRILYHEAWNVRVTDLYSTEEVGYIALQCPQHDHYHVMSENIYVEILDDSGNPCRPGQAGRVILSTLNNFAMPMLRYDIGDIAIASDEPCSCGRSLPVITRILGRKRNRLILPDGRSEFPYLGEHGQLEAICGQKPRQFQFIQKSTDSVLVRLVLDRPMTADEEGRYASILQANLGHPFRILYEYLDHIPASSRGKFEEFMSEVDIRTPA